MARAADPLARLFLESVPPLDVADLGRGARLLVPNGAAFGTPQLWRAGGPWDWVRQAPDGYWVEGDRGSAHAGVDFAYYVRGGLVRQLPAGLPVRAPCDGVLERAGRGADPEPGPGGVVLALGAAPGPRLYVHLVDFRVTARRGARVRKGETLGATAPYSEEFPFVVLHFGVGVLLRGAPPNPLDPTPLLRRWKVRHPVEPDSGCDASQLPHAAPARWIAPGRIEGDAPAALWSSEWRDVWG
ncbi:MAG TPA: hypothetical protein VEI02_08500 [Planctomycetota bacterium]|nr:hypothetical protein [Planctomycetota bacterium]